MKYNLVVAIEEIDDEGNSSPDFKKSEEFVLASADAAECAFRILRIEMEEFQRANA